MSFIFRMMKMGSDAEQFWKQICSDKSQGILSIQLAWENAMTTFRSSGLSVELTRKVLECCPHPASLLAFCRSLSGLSSEEVESVLADKVAKCANDSPFDYGDWLSALIQLAELIEKSGPSSDIERMVGYLECCVEASQSRGDDQSLEVLVRKMIEEYGFER